GDQLAVEPAVGKHPATRHVARRQLAEHVAQQPDDVDLAVGGLGPGVGLRDLALHIPGLHVEARAGARLDVAARDQPVVGLHHGEPRYAVLGREAPDRWHARPRPHQSLVDTAGIVGDDPLDQRAIAIRPQDVARDLDRGPAGLRAGRGADVGVSNPLVHVASSVRARRPNRPPSVPVRILTGLHTRTGRPWATVMAERPCHPGLCLSERPLERTEATRPCHHCRMQSWPYPTLLADIGGTNVRFALAEEAGATPTDLAVLGTAHPPPLADAR